MLSDFMQTGIYCQDDQYQHPDIDRKITVAQTKRVFLSKVETRSKILKDTTCMQ